MYTYMPFSIFAAKTKQYLVGGCVDGGLGDVLKSLRVITHNTYDKQMKKSTVGMDIDFIL